MQPKLPILAVALAASWPAGVTAQDARSIFAEVAAKQAQRWADVENYLIEQLTDGAPIAVPTYFERNVLPDGRTTFRQVPIDEWSKKAAGTEAIRPADYELLADGYEMVGAVHGSDPNNPLNSYIAGMMDDGAGFLRAGAEAERSGAAYADEDLDAANVHGMAAFAERARLIGRETVGARNAFHLRADDLSDIPIEQPEGGAKLTLLASSVWIDAEHHVPLRMVMDMQVEADGRTSPITLELRMEDYEQVGPLFEATRHVMRMSGIQAMMNADPEDRKKWEEAQRELAEARAQMAEMEEQLARLPPAARGMVEGQMKKALQQMELMENEGAMETVVRRKVVAVNQGPPAQWTPTLVPGGP